jgi:hypothetical protein
MQKIELQQKNNAYSLIVEDADHSEESRFKYVSNEDKKNKRKQVCARIRAKKEGVEGRESGWEGEWGRKKKKRGEEKDICVVKVRMGKTRSRREEGEGVES